MIARWLKKILRLARDVMLFLAMFLALAWIYVAAALPSVDYLQAKNPEYSSFMRSDSYFGQNDILPEPIRFVPLATISRSLIRSVLVSEDNGFFSHDGFDWNALRAAFDFNRKKGRFRHGASTLTQQLARNLFLKRDKTVLRKIREWILTWRLENSLDKTRILELYLNVAEFGPGVYGVAQASSFHFNTLPENLGFSQAALLTAILPNPKRYGKKPYPAFTWVRQRKILVKMASYHLEVPDGLLRPPPTTAQKTSITKTKITPPSPVPSMSTHTVMEEPLRTQDIPFLDE